MARKKTNAEFIKEVKQLVGDEYIFLQEYINSTTKIRCKHNIEDCDFEWDITPNNFLKGRRCPKCSGRVQRTNKEFIEEVKQLVGDEYIFLEEYINVDTKIKCKHNINSCNHEWYITPSNFLTGRRCPKCKGKRISESKTKTHEQYEKEVFDLVGDEYSIVGRYINSQTKITMYHAVCNHKWDSMPSDFIQGCRCPKCANINRSEKLTKTNEEFLEEVYKIVGNEYEFLEDYKGVHTKIKCRHNECDNEWDITPDSFLHGTRCPKCFGTPKKTNEEFKQEVYNLVGDEYEVLEEYIDTNTKILFKHIKCGNEWSVIPSNFLRGTRCPECALSKGEDKILKLLKNKNITCIPQYSFDDCRNINPLPFDFYLPEYNMLIEYDGELHFIPIEYFGGQEKLEYTQQNDNIKNKYCKTQNIKLLRIPYWEFNNIEQILNDELKVGEEECRNSF